MIRSIINSLFRNYLSPTPCPNTGILWPHLGWMFIGFLTSSRVSPGCLHCVILFLGAVARQKYHYPAFASSRSGYTIEPVSILPLFATSLEIFAPGIISLHTCGYKPENCISTFQRTSGIICPFTSQMWTDKRKWLRFF